MKGSLLTKDSTKKGKKGGGGGEENFFFPSPAIQKIEIKTSIKSSPWGPETEMFEIRLE
jgi:hypothetical protein